MVIMANTDLAIHVDSSHRKKEKKKENIFTYHK